MAEAGDLDRARRPLEQLARAEAVAHRPGADANRVGRYLQEGVERDDLVHLAAADVHVVGDGVRELHRDRPDLAAHAAEVVEEACPLAWKLGEQRCEPQDVHRGESIPRLEASGAPSSARGGASPRGVARAPAALGFVATRRRGTASAARSFSTSRSTASSRLRAWLRSSCATARSTGPDARDDAPLLGVRERRRRLDVEERLDPRRGLLRMLPAGPARARHTQLDLRDGQQDGACDANRLTLHGVHSARHRRRAARLRRPDSGRLGRRLGAPSRGPRSPVRLEQLDPAAIPPRRRASRHGLHARGRGDPDDARGSRA